MSSRPWALALLLGTLLLVGLFGSAAQAQGVTPFKPGQLQPIDIAPKPVRLRMELEMRTPLPESQDLGPLNTENEIFYGVLAMQKGRNPNFKVMKRSGDPDIWEMGGNSGTKLQRWLFRGSASPLAPVTVGLFVGEQDSIRNISWSQQGWGTDFDADVRPNMIELANRVHTNAHAGEVMALQITIRGERMTVKASRPGWVISPIEQGFLVEAEDHKGYRVRLMLEPDTGAAPIGLEYIGLEDDNCGQANLYVTGTTGDVLVKQGETRNVPIAKQSFDWHCAGTLEHAVARPGTHTLEVKRATGDNRRVQWKCLRRVTLTPDITF